MLFLEDCYLSERRNRHIETVIHSDNRWLDFSLSWWNQKKSWLYKSWLYCLYCYIHDHSVVVWPQHIVHIWFPQSESFSIYTHIYISFYLFLYYYLDIQCLSPDDHLFWGPHFRTRPHIDSDVCWIPSHMSILLYTLNYHYLLSWEHATRGWGGAGGVCVVGWGGGGGKEDVLRLTLNNHNYFMRKNSLYVW